MKNTYFNSFKLIFEIIFRLVLLFYFCSFCPSCTDNQTPTSSRSSSTPIEDPDVDGRDGGDKPSDDSGGIPGYLIDPSMISAFYNKIGDNITVQATSNAIKTNDSFTGQRVLTFWEINNSALAEKKYIEQNGQQILPGVALCSFKPESDGSFTKEIKATKGLILTSNQQTSAGLENNICQIDSAVSGIIIKTNTQSAVTAIKIVPTDKWDSVFSTLPTNTTDGFEEPETAQNSSSGAKSEEDTPPPVGTFEALSF